MAPEQILGEEIDHRSDLYTLGAMLYMCLTGQNHLKPQQWPSIWQNILYETPIHPCDINPEIPQYLGDLCDILLKKTPEERLTSAQSVQKFLRKEQSVTTPIGLETPLQHLLDWQKVHSQGIILLNSLKGLGSQLMFNHLNTYWHSKDWNVIQDTSAIQEDRSNIVVFMSTNTRFDQAPCSQLLTIHILLPPMYDLKLKA